MPQEVEVSWQVFTKETNDRVLGDGVVRLGTTSSHSGVEAAAAGPLVLGDGAVSLAAPSFLGGSGPGDPLPAPSSASPDFILAKASMQKHQPSTPQALQSQPAAVQALQSQPPRSTAKSAQGQSAARASHPATMAPLSVSSGAQTGFPAAANAWGAYSSSEVPVQHPKHIVVEGVTVWGGIANGVYRRAQEQMHQRPVYHKADAVHVASLWYTGSDWWLGPAAGGDHAWIYAPSAALSPLLIDTTWRHLDRGLQETVQLRDAAQAIPKMVFVAGHHYEQLHRLCDARPVYRRTQPLGGGGDVAVDAAIANDVYLFFRAYECEWLIGPTIGGVDSYARAAGSHLRVVPDPGTLNWYPVASETGSGFSGSRIVSRLPGGAAGHSWRSASWDLVITSLSVAAVCASLALLVWASRLRRKTAASVAQAEGEPNPASAAPPWQPPNIAEAKTGDSEAPRWADDGMSSISTSSRSASSTSSSSRPKRRSAVACVVCYEAPREILLEPCRHVCCCKVCADKLTHCPMCRALKVSFTEVFLFREHRRRSSAAPG